MGYPKFIMTVRDDKRKALLQTMHAYGIYEKDLEETFTRGQGKGGQKVNTTANAVHLKHKPTGISVQCHKERSREINRYYARKLLLEHYQQQHNIPTKRDRQREKVQKQKARRRRRTQKKLQKNTDE